MTDVIGPGPTCPECGHPNEPGARFCTSCGAELSRVVCQECGQTSEPGARFCSACGAEIVVEEPVEEIETFSLEDFGLGFVSDLDATADDLWSKPHDEGHCALCGKDIEHAWGRDVFGNGTTICRDCSSVAEKVWLKARSRIPAPGIEDHRHFPFATDSQPHDGICREFMYATYVALSCIPPHTDGDQAEQEAVEDAYDRGAQYLVWAIGNSRDMQDEVSEYVARKLAEAQTEIQAETQQEERERAHAIQAAVNNAAANEQQAMAMARRQNMAYVGSDGVARCPRCGSTSLAAQAQGFSTGKAVAGAVLFGGIGLVAGNIGSHKTIVKCLKCGYSWKM